MIDFRRYLWRMNILNEFVSYKNFILSDEDNKNIRRVMNQIPLMFKTRYNLQCNIEIFDDIFDKDFKQNIR